VGEVCAHGNEDSRKNTLVVQGWQVLARQGGEYDAAGGGQLEGVGGGRHVRYDDDST